MKLIDQKGKLFGKVNIIDLVVVLLIIFLVGAVGYKVVGPKSSPQAKSEATVMVKCTFRTENAVKSLKVGQQLVFGTAFIDDAFITDVKYVAADYITTTSTGEVRVVKHPYLKDVFVTFKTPINANSAILKVGSQELSQGKEFAVKTQTSEIKGLVETIEIKK